MLPNSYMAIAMWRAYSIRYLHDVRCARFAKAPTAIRTDWNEFTKDYFLKRETLVCVLLLVDSSIDPQQIDIDCIDWLGRNKVTMDATNVVISYYFGSRHPRTCLILKFVPC